MKARILLMCVFLAAPASAPAVDKAIQELQRDMALLQQQIKDLQRSQDEKFASIAEIARQAADAANRANTNAAVIQSNLDKSLKATADNVVTPVAGLSTRMREISDNVATLTQAVSDLTSTLNRMQSQLTDINNQIKTLQAPPKPPEQPQAGGGPGAPGAAAAASNTPCMGSTSLYNNARSDYSSGKFDMAASEFADYLRCYGNTDYAPNAQFYIGMIHYGQRNFESAVHEFDAVLEKYSDNNKTPEALLYKGRALAQMQGHKTEGANEFREVIRRFPRSDQAKMACDDLKSLGFNCPVATAAPPKKSTPRKK
jgi:tol-pal system protein YbgF